MGLEKNWIEVCIANMGANSALYRRVAEAKRLQEYELELAVAEAWAGAADMLQEMYEGVKDGF